MKERVEQRRRQLIEATIQVAWTQGLQQIKIHAICAQAGLTSRYFYESFDGIEDVCDVIHEELSGALLQQVSEAITGVPAQPEPVADAVLRAFFSFIRDDPRRAPFVLAHPAEQFPGVDSQDGGSRKPYPQMVMKVLALAYPQSAQLADLDYIAHGLAGMIAYPAAAWVSEGLTRSVDQMVQAQLIIWRGLNREFRHLLEEPLPSAA